jgi:Condensin II complex subunit CAP-H2 or CNDH2, C-term
MPDHVVSRPTKCGQGLATYLYLRAPARAFLTMSHLLPVQVTSWRDSISKVMVEQDTRPVFDIHHVGTSIVDRTVKLSTKGQKQLPFKVIVRCQQKYEVARCFSAFLQQVNNEAVEIVRGITPSDPFFVMMGSSRAVE